MRTLDKAKESIKLYEEERTNLREEVEGIVQKVEKILGV